MNKDLRLPALDHLRQIPIIVDNATHQSSGAIRARCDHGGEAGARANFNFDQLRPLKVIDGRRIVQVGGELLVDADGLIEMERLQAFPGEMLRNLDARCAFPSLDQVGQYISRTEFEKVPKVMAQWVHWPERVRMVLDGRYHELPPVHMEGIFTLVCNFMCPHCSRRVTRTEWVEGGTWENSSEVERRNTMHPDDLMRVIDQLAEFRTDEQMGIVWGGGDPTANPFTYDAMLYARKRGITASFLTNGVFLDVDKCLEADPILIRISLNCGTEEAYRRFHGYPRGWDHFGRIKSKIRELVKKKVGRRARTLVGISLIMDERNLADAVAAAEEIRAVVNDAGPGIDYVIVRPVFHYSTTRHTRLQLDTKAKAQALISEGGQIAQIIDSLGIPLIPIKDSYDMPPPPEFYKDTRCLAYGICGEIRHNGDVQLCSDSYGNPEYTIGNLRESNIREIWTSSKRKEVLDRINTKECYRTHCPHNSRGHHFNRLFHQIEEMRVAGRLGEVERWIGALRDVTYPMGHSFFV